MLCNETAGLKPFPGTLEVGATVRGLSIDNAGLEQPPAPIIGSDGEDRRGSRGIAAAELNHRLIYLVQVPLGPMTRQSASPLFRMNG